MTARRPLALLGLLTVLGLSGCDPFLPPTGSSVATSPEPVCPYPANTIQFNGDSNGVPVSGYLNVPGYLVKRGAQGGAAFSIDTGVPTIVSRVQDMIGKCGKPKLLIIEGSTNDFTHQRGSAETIAAVAGLSSWVKSQGIRTLWIAMQPVPHNDSWSAPMLRARTEYNAWLTKRGNVYGSVVDPTAVLENPMDRGWLDPRFYQPADLFGVPDPLHLNDAGYRVFAAQVSAAAVAVLAGATS